MEFNPYIQQALIKKNRGIYFSKGKWLIHVLYFIIYIFYFLIENTGNNLEQIPKFKLLSIVSVCICFLSFFYIYALLLVPLLFKTNKQKLFWIVTASLILLFNTLDVVLKWWNRPFLPLLYDNTYHLSFFSIWLKNLVTFVTCFFGYSSLLYFMELLEEVRTQKQMQVHLQDVKAAEIYRIKSQLNPPLINKTLEAIIEHSQQKNAPVSEAIIHFSDLLRYRLYKSTKALVPLQEEIEQAQHFMALQKILHPHTEHFSLDFEGVIHNQFIIPQTIMNWIEPIIAQAQEHSCESLVLYGLIEDKSLEIALEITDSNSAAIVAVIQHTYKDLQKILNTDLNFTLETDNDNLSVRLCIPLYNK
jgi:two-component system LytT family sensor kinase